MNSASAFRVFRGFSSVWPQLLMVTALLPAAPSIAKQQPPPRSRPPVVYTTPPAGVRAVVVVDPLTELKVGGQATLTITRANEDDTITGTLQYSFDPESRTKVAAALKRAEVPTTLARTDVTAKFRDGSACPVAHLVIDRMTFESSGVRLSLPQLTLTVVEDRDEMTPQLCFWARQINVGKMRRGVIAAINRLIRGEDDK